MTVRPSAFRGIQIRVHPSVVVVIGFIVLLLARLLLPAESPGHSLSTYVVAGVVGAVVFLGSLLAHELAHALVARRNGQQVRSVTLWALGGVTDIEGEPARPAHQIWLAAVGPLVSAVLGGLLLGSGLVAGGLVGQVLEWVGAANLAIAVFNLLPGAPLDGGRILTGVLWWRTGDRRRAVISSARAGRFVGLGLLGLGVLEALTVSVVGGLWLAFIGWFLAGSATAEGTRGRLDSSLVGLRVRDVMQSIEPKPGWLTVDAFLERVALPSHASVFALVGFDGQPAGLVTLARLAAVPAEQRTSTRVSAVAAPAAVLGRAAPDEPAGVLLERIGAGGAVLVVEDGVIVGVVTPIEFGRAVELAPLRHEPLVTSPQQ